MRFNRKTSPGQEHSRLTLRLWDFTGTALLNLFVFLFLIAYLSPLPFMIISSLTPHDQFLDSNAPILPSKRVKFHYEGKDLIVYQIPTAQGIKHWALYKPSRQSSLFIDPENPEAGPILWEGAWRTLKADYTFAPTLDKCAVRIEQQLGIVERSAIALVDADGHHHARLLARLADCKRCWRRHRHRLLEQ